jgi:hypothetical protein
MVATVAAALSKAFPVAATARGTALGLLLLTGWAVSHSADSAVDKAQSEAALERIEERVNDIRARMRENDEEILRRLERIEDRLNGIKR